jgi:folate-binding protein YgfZ
MYASVADQYQAITGEAGLLDLSSRGKLKATGADHLTFLHAMITNDVLQLPERKGHRGCLLTATGKIIADFYFYRFADSVLLDLPPGLVPSTRAALERYIVMDEVELNDLSRHLAHFWLLGPMSAGVLGDRLHSSLPEGPGEVREVNWTRDRLWIINKPQFGLPGYEILLRRDGAEDFQELLIADQRVSAARFEALNLLRLEKGVPLFGTDYGPDNNPLEVGLTEAISYTKGCYVGQEVISKATYVGGVNRSLVQLRLEGDRVPEEGAELIDEEERRIGQVTSAAFSPTLGQVVALAFIRRRDLAERTSARVRIGGAVYEATIKIRSEEGPEQH